MANVAIEKVWKVALDTGANVLALTVTEAAASSGQMDQKRSILNSFIKHHQHKRLYVSFPSLALADQSYFFSTVLYTVTYRVLAIPVISTARFPTQNWTRLRVTGCGMMDYI